MPLGRTTRPETASAAPLPIHLSSPSSLALTSLSPSPSPSQMSQVFSSVGAIGAIDTCESEFTVRTSGGRRPLWLRADGRRELDADEEEEEGLELNREDTEERISMCSESISSSSSSEPEYHLFGSHHISSSYVSSASSSYLYGRVASVPS